MIRKPDNIEATPDGGRMLTYKCPFCGNVTSIVLGQDEASNLFSGVCNGNRKQVQDILLGKSSIERRLMTTGLCHYCQEAFLD